jgi:hypothetical protein
VIEPRWPWWQAHPSVPTAAPSRARRRSLRRPAPFVPEVRHEVVEGSETNAISSSFTACARLGLDSPRDVVAEPLEDVTGLVDALDGDVWVDVATPETDERSGSFASIGARNDREYHRFPHACGATDATP